MAGEVIENSIRWADPICGFVGLAAVGRQVTQVARSRETVQVWPIAVRYLMQHRANIRTGS